MWKRDSAVGALPRLRLLALKIGVFNAEERRILCSLDVLVDEAEGEGGGEPSGLLLLGIEKLDRFLNLPV